MVYTAKYTANSILEQYCEWGLESDVGLKNKGLRMILKPLINAGCAITVTQEWW